MDEIGVDISGQHSKSVLEYMGKIHFGYLITVCSEADKNCPTTFPGISQRLRWDLEDPVKFIGTEEQKLNKFREIRDQIKNRVEQWVGDRPQEHRQ
jgi:arsenate reductase